MGAGLELIGRRRDGTEFPVNVSLSLMDTEDGMLVIAAVRDMTRHKQTEQQNDRMDQLAAIVEYSDDAILGKTLDGVITSWNPAAETMFGYSENEIIGKSIELLSPENRAGEMTAILSRISAGQHLEHFETIRVRRDGTVFPVSLSVSPICEADGAIIGASTIARDLTGQRQGFDAARSMIEASLDSLVAISPEGKITDANQATVKVTGVSREELIGTSFSDYFTEPDEANKIYQLVFAEGMALNYPLTIRHRNGTATEVLYNASVYRDANGKVLGVFAAARDVTEQVQGQKEVAKQQAKGLERLAELEQFQRLTVGRELKMIELKKEIEYLRRLLPPSASDPDDQF
jgi:PAS domain S-box-containing protein